MTAFNYSAVAARAATLIEKYGRSLTIMHKDGNNLTSHTGKGILEGAGRFSEYTDRVDVEHIERTATTTPLTPPVEPKIADTISFTGGTIDNGPFRITAVEPLAPAGIPVIYYLALVKR